MPRVSPHLAEAELLGLELGRNEKGAAAASQPGGVTPSRFASSAKKILDFSSPNPGSARNRASSPSPEETPVHTFSALAP